MMTSLVFAAGFSFIIGFLVLSNYFSNRFCVAVLLVKVSIPVGYFLATGKKWIPYDGIAFQRSASELIKKGYTPWSILFHWDFFSDYVSSQHVMPYWWNMLGQYLFGPYYFAPVFLNVIVTILIGLYMVFILSRTGFSETYYTYFFAFFLFQWDIITWSSFINIKGVVTTLFIIAYMYHFIMALSESEQGQKLFHAITVVAILYGLYWTRFYTIFILGASSIAWIALEANYKKSLLFGVSGVILLYPIGRYGYVVARNNGYLEQIDVASFLLAILRILLTPRPWGVLSNFSFLTPSSILHWLFFVPSMLFGLRLCYRHKNMRFLTVYLSIFVLFYSIFPDLASARMRFQVVFVFAVFQFHFLWRISQSVRLKQNLHILKAE